MFPREATCTTPHSQCPPAHVATRWCPAWWRAAWWLAQSWHVASRQLARLFGCPGLLQNLMYVGNHNKTLKPAVLLLLWSLQCNTWFALVVLGEQKENLLWRNECWKMSWSCWSQQKYEHWPQQNEYLNRSKPRASLYDHTLRLMQFFRMFSRVAMFISALCPFLAELEPRETPVVLDLHFS